MGLIHRRVVEEFGKQLKETFFFFFLEFKEMLFQHIKIFLHNALHLCLISLSEPKPCEYIAFYEVDTVMVDHLKVLICQ